MLVLHFGPGNDRTDACLSGLEEGLSTLIDLFRTEAKRPFVHTVQLDIGSPLAASTWTEKLP